MCIFQIPQFQLSIPLLSSVMCPLSPCTPVSLSTLAKATIIEIEPYVLAVTLSDISMEERIFLNITTKEGNHFTVEQSSLGLQVMSVVNFLPLTWSCQVVGLFLNTSSLTDQPIYETPASLLNTISKEYTRAFASHLIDKLQALVEEQIILSLTSCQLGSDWNEDIWRLSELSAY